MVEAGVVDAFAEDVFGGNPAAVVLLPDEQRDDAWMQAVAAEFNLSETAFIVPSVDGQYDLRWFTPTAEVELCGHATLAAAHWLWETGHTTADRLTFHTASGPLGAHRSTHGITLDLPLVPIEDRTPLPGLEVAFGGLETEYLGQTGQEAPMERNAVVLLHAADLRGLRPDLRAIAHLPVGGLIVTAPGDRDGVDFISRYFAPAVGIDEDPVTGSAHCTLIEYWAGRLRRTELVARQVSVRGGTIRLRQQGDRVLVTGRAVTAWDAELRC